MIKVLVIGETCVDKFIYSEVTKLSPEAPIPVLKPISVVENKGMSGNVVENVKSMLQGVEVVHWHQPEIITKTRFVESKSNHMFIRVDENEEKITPINVEFKDKDYLSDFNITIVSDYNKGFLSNEDLVFIGRHSNLSILDSKRKLTENIIESYYFVKLNEQESNLNKRLSMLKNVIVTLGAKGASYDNTLYPSVNPKETIDVSGAGDTFTSAFIIKYFLTKNISESITYANQMSSIVVSKRGVVTP